MFESEKEAERTAGDEFRRQWMMVLSGGGAKGYYRESGYGAQGAYMVKRLVDRGRVPVLTTIWLRTLGRGRLACRFRWR